MCLSEKNKETEKWGAALQYNEILPILNSKETENQYVAASVDIVVGAKNKSANGKH